MSSTARDLMTSDVRTVPSGMPIAELDRAFIDAGMSNLVLSFTCPAEQMSEQIEQCAADLLPRLRQ